MPLARAWHLAASVAVPDDAVAEEVAGLAELFGNDMDFLQRALLQARAAELSSRTDQRSRRLRLAAKSAAVAGATHLSSELTAAATETTVGDPLGTPVPLGSGLLPSTGLHHNLWPGHLALRALDRMPDIELERVPDTGAHAGLPRSGRPSEDRNSFDRLTTDRDVWFDGSLGSRIVESLRVWQLAGLLAASPLMRQSLDDLLTADDADLVTLAPYGASIASALWDAEGLRLLLTRAQVIAAKRRAHGVGGELASLARITHLMLGQCLTPDRGTTSSAMASGAPDLLHLERRYVHLMALIANGKYAEALSVTATAQSATWRARCGHLVPDLVEAASRTGRADVAVQATHQLEEISQVVQDSTWASGVVARARALTTPGDPASYFEASVGELESINAVGELARTLLLFGEWLRRDRKRGKAAEHLERACHLFAEVEHPMLERAQGALALARGNERRAADLTQQEFAVASLAAKGASNIEIAQQMFLSRHTVDFHLRKVYQKLDISSRRSLPEVIPG